MTFAVSINTCCTLGFELVYVAGMTVKPTKVKNILKAVIRVEPITVY